MSGIVEITDGGDWLEVRRGGDYLFLGRPLRASDLVNVLLTLGHTVQYHVNEAVDVNEDDDGYPD